MPKLFGPWPPALFLATVLMMIAISRATVILTSHDDAQMDLSIYQEVGELVTHGIDPYDFERDRPQRDALRLDDYGAAPWITRDAGGYDYYVSSNLPGSTALYGLLQRLSNGNPKIWRLALASGDLLIALAAFFLLASAGFALDTLRKQILFSLAAIYYPSNIQWGLLTAEDKQFETALMLALAGLLIAPNSARQSLKALLIGAIGALSLIFKAFGIFLAPLALNYFRIAPRRELVLALCAAAATFIPFVFMFDLAFVRLIFARVAGGISSSNTSFHGSPWQLLPVAAGYYLRPLLCLGLTLLVGVAFIRGKLDLLNSSAAIAVICVCLWVVGGSMDRMNIVMIFAIFCAATVSMRFWQRVVLTNFGAQFFIYAALIARTRWLDFFNAETPDAIATAAFVISYFGSLVTEWRAPACLGDPALAPLRQTRSAQ